MNTNSQNKDSLSLNSLVGGNSSPAKFDNYSVRPIAASLDGLNFLLKAINYYGLECN